MASNRCRELGPILCDFIFVNNIMWKWAEGMLVASTIWLYGIIGLV